VQWDKSRPSEDKMENNQRVDWLMVERMEVMGMSFLIYLLYKKI